MAVIVVRGYQVPDSLVVDVALGLVFTFAALAALTSALTETISRFLGLRGDYLLRGLRALIDGQDKPAPLTTSAQPTDMRPVKLWGTLGGEAASNKMTASPIGSGASRAEAAPLQPPSTTGADGAKTDGPPEEAATQPASGLFLCNALLGSQGLKNLVPQQGARLTRAMKRELPSYISSRSFASTVLAMIAPDASGTTTMAQLSAEIGKLPDGVLRKSLQSLAAGSGGDVNRFRESVEAWYDDHMARVSGWYKRHVRWISIVIGAVLVIGANVSAIGLSRSLYSDQAVRETVVTQAVASSNCSSKSAATCIDEARDAIGKLHAGGLPVGWGTVAACQAKDSSCSWLQRYGLTSTSGNAVHKVLSSLLLVLGWALTAFALTPGARFWFDILSKLGTLRSTGPKPSST
ncbi:MAG TPA: hypothetical protein VIM10_07440 [Actinopolymorphaceae bacterium]|jgi:hypothetical protein